MKGFIEVTIENNSTKDLISVDSILRVIDTEPVLIVTKELVSRYECNNDNKSFYVQETYEEIKQLIIDAQ